MTTNPTPSREGEAIKAEAELILLWLNRLGVMPFDMPIEAMRRCANAILALTQSIPDEPTEAVEEFLHELDGWERAYPLSAFPEPDLKQAAALLRSGGMTLDAVSASNMRHVVSCIAPKARAAIAALQPQEPGQSE